MDRACATILMLAVFGLVGKAHAAEALILSERQMDIVTAGSASAAAALEASAAGRNSTIRTTVGNVAADRPHFSFAQSRTAVLATGASVTADLVNQSTANGYSATAESSVMASGDVASVRALATTTAINVTGPLRGISIGVTKSLAVSISFSASGNKTHSRF
jgi:hypothetical protein